MHGIRVGIPEIMVGMRGMGYQGNEGNVGKNAGIQRGNAGNQGENMGYAENRCADVRDLGNQSKMWDSGNQSKMWGDQCGSCLFLKNSPVFLILFQQPLDYYHNSFKK